MSKSISGFWSNWMLVALISIILFSLISFVLLPDVGQLIFNLIIFRSTDAGGRFDETAAHYIKFAFGVLGAITIGWCFSLLAVFFTLFKQGYRAGWNAMALSLLVWFVVDSTFSIIMGFAANAAFNVVFFLALAIPLAATYKEFSQTETTLTSSAAFSTSK